MDTIDTEKKLCDYEDRIRIKFPDVLMEFSSRTFTTHAELLVYVLNLDKYAEVQDYTKSLVPEAESNDLPVWIFARKWTGPWPGGQSEDQIRRRREDFLRQHHLHRHHLPTPIVTPVTTEGLGQTHS